MAEPIPSSARIPLIEAKAVWKFFSGVAILKGVDLTLAPGQVHALLGGNGAGKSTLMKIVAGLHCADRGEITVGGQPVRAMTPALSRQLGIHLVPQEPLLFPSLSVEENVLMHLPGNRVLQRARLVDQIRELGAALELHTPAGQLEVADQQMVEILRGLMRQARILILDEPTSALTPREARRLFTRIEALTAQGVGIFFISHKLREIRAIADTVSILRDGKVVLAGPPRDFSDAEIVRAMTKVDGPTGRHGTGAAAPAPKPGAELLRAEGLSGEGFADVSFRLHAGEILGLAGVVGSGRTELAETLYGIRSAARGRIWVAGKEVTAPSPKESLENGLVYLPEDRQASGLFVDAPLSWNASALILYRQSWRLPLKAELKRLEAYVRGLGIVCASPHQAARTLSGGNQQKLLLAKCLAADPKILVLDEPTRGVDVAVRNDIYRLIDELAADGMAILLISSDHDEVQRLSQRVLVMNHGYPGGELQGSEITVDNIAQLAFGVSDAKEAVL